MTPDSNVMPATGNQYCCNCYSKFANPSSNRGVLLQEFDREGGEKWRNEQKARRFREHCCTDTHAEREELPSGWAFSHQFGQSYINRNRSMRCRERLDHYAMWMINIHCTKSRR